MRRSAKSTDDRTDDRADDVAVRRLCRRASEAYLVIGELSAAQAVLERTVAYYLRTSGLSHPDTLRSLADLREAKAARERHDEKAAALLSQARSVRMRSAG